VYIKKKKKFASSANINVRRVLFDQKYIFTLSFVHFDRYRQFEARGNRAHLEYQVPVVVHPVRRSLRLLRHAPDERLFPQMDGHTSSEYVVASASHGTFDHTATVHRSPDRTTTTMEHRPVDTNAQRLTKQSCTRPEVQKARPEWLRGAVTDKSTHVYMRENDKKNCSPSEARLLLFNRCRRQCCRLSLRARARRKYDILSFYTCGRRNVGANET